MGTGATINKLQHTQANIPSAANQDHRTYYAALTSMLWDEGVISSYFLPVKMSMQTKLHLA